MTADRRRRAVTRLRADRHVSERRARCFGRDQRVELPLRVPRVVPPAPTRPNARWSMDFIEDALTEGRTFRCLCVVDDVTRECPVIAVDHSLPAVRVLDADRLEAVELATKDDLDALVAPMTGNFGLRGWSQPVFGLFSDLQVTRTDNPLDPAVINQPGVWGWGAVATAFEGFETAQAAEQAINIWNASVLGMRKDQSVVEQIRKTFEVFDRIVKLKAFKERRVHRLALPLASHARLLMLRRLTHLAA